MELWGSETLGWTVLDSRTARPTCQLAWPPTPSLSDKRCRVAVWARCPWRGKHFIKLKCFCNGGTETSAQCGIHRHHASFPLPDSPTPQSCGPTGLSQRTPGAARPLCPQNLAPNSRHTVLLVSALALGPTCLGPLNFVLNALKEAQPSSLPTTEGKTHS